jgi:hypothetical protein
VAQGRRLSPMERIEPEGKQPFDHEALQYVGLDLQLVSVI